MSIIPRLNNSLCGCTVEAGSMIIAWLCVIMISLEALIGAVYVTTIYLATEAKAKANLPTETDEKLYIEIKFIMAIVVAVMAFVFVINLLLLIGIYKRNHCLMTPWVMLSFIGYAFSILAVAINLVYALFHPALLIGTFIHAIFTGVGLYCFLIVYSHYRNLMEEKDMNTSNFKNMKA